MQLVYDKDLMRVLNYNLFYNLLMIPWDSSIHNQNDKKNLLNKRQFIKYIKYSLLKKLYKIQWIK